MEKNSCFEMMGLDAYNKISKTGLVDSMEDFNSKHLAFVNHFVRGAQASFRLGRATNFAASTIHLSANELPPGVKLTTLEEGRDMVYNPGESMSEYSLWMRCVLARARVKDFVVATIMENLLLSTVSDEISVVQAPGSLPC